MLIFLLVPASFFLFGRRTFGFKKPPGGCGLLISARGIFAGNGNRTRSAAGKAEASETAEERRRRRLGEEVKKSKEATGAHIP